MKSSLKAQLDSTADAIVSRVRSELPILENLSEEVIMDRFTN